MRRSPEVSTNQIPSRQFALMTSPLGACLVLVSYEMYWMRRAQCRASLPAPCNAHYISTLNIYTTFPPLHRIYFHHFHDYSYLYIFTTDFLLSYQALCTLISEKYSYFPSFKAETSISALLSYSYSHHHSTCTPFPTFFPSFILLNQ